MADGFLEGDVGDAAVLRADHHVALAFEDGLDGRFAQARGQDAVQGRGRAAPLDVAQDRHARVVLRELLLHALGQAHGAARAGVLGHEHDRRVLALAEAVVDEFAQLIDLGLHFGDDGRFAARGDGAVEGQVARRVAHHLNEEEPFVARSRVAQLVHRLHDGVERRVVADGGVGAAQVVVDGAGQPHDRHVVFAGEDRGARERAVAADDHQGVDAGGRHVFVGRAASFGGFELTAACGLEHRAALLYDVAHTL